MNLLQFGNIFVTYIRTTNDTNGNARYLVNFFKKTENNNIININYKIDKRKDKKENIIMKSYNIEYEITNFVSRETL